EHESANLVDEIVCKQGVKQIAAALGDQGWPVRLFELGDVGGRVLQRNRTAPAELDALAAGDVLGRGVETLGDGVVFAPFGERPVGGENLVGLAPEQQVERLGKQGVDLLAEHLVDIGDHPAAEFEA